MARVPTKRWVLAASAIVVAAVFSSLGGWQLRRAQQQEMLDAAFAAGAQSPAVRDLPGAADGFRYRRVELTGRYDARAQVLLDNSTHEGTVGYEIVTPFVISGAERAVVVNRGWVPASPDRSILPAVAVDSMERTLRARIDRLPVPALRLGQDARAPAGPLHVLSFPQQSDLESALDRPLFPYLLLLDDGEADGYLREWEPPGPSAERNLAYAGQWFLFAAVTLLGGLAAAMRRGFVGVRP